MPTVRTSSKSMAEGPAPIASEGVLTIFAILAAICFLLALFKVAVGTINLVTLGLLFVACHLIWGWGYPLFAARRQP